MRVITDYFIKKSGDEYTMLPYGQAIAEHLPELKLNHSGVRIYRLLQSGLRGDELVEAMADGEPLDAEAMESLASDINDFIAYLRGHGVVVEDTVIPQAAADARFRIADIPIYYYGDRLLVDDKLWSFADDGDRREGSDSAEADDKAENDSEAIPPLRISLQTSRPRVLSTGNILLRTEELIVSEDDGAYHIIYLSYKFVRELHIAKESGDTVICTARRDNGSCDTDAGRADGAYRADNQSEENAPLTPSDEVFFAMRTSFLLYAARFGCFALHSSSIVYRDRVYCFSASAGTGKSTHTALWGRVFGTPIANGDLNLISTDGEKAYVHGIPWCGTSEQYETAVRELGGIILLERGQEDRTERLSPAEAARLVRLRLITPAWEEGLLYANTQFADELCGHIPVAKLFCTPTENAARVMKEEIDRWII